jgi:transmembrane sensor
MGEFHLLPESDRVLREAGEWIARLNADDFSSADRLRYETWRRAHPMHVRVFDSLAATWDAYLAAGPLIRAVSFGESINAATKVRAPRRRSLLAAAAAGAIALAIGGAWYTVHRAPETFQTAIGEHATIALADGSTLDLNSNSLARVEYGDRARVIRLERGEAFFKVMHDDSRPFWVVGGGSWVRAVGTAFNVYLRPDGVRVTVSEGTVKLGAVKPSEKVPVQDDAVIQSQASVLTVGEQGDILGSATQVRSLPPAELARSVSWRTGTLYFENQPLSDVISELNRYTTLKLHIAGERVRNLSVGGTFQANPQGVEEFLSMLKEGFGLTIRRNSRDIYIENDESAAQLPTS